MTMKRLVTACLMLLCLVPFVAAADGIPWDRWEQSKAFVRQEAADAFPGWTVIGVGAYGSGTRHDEMALIVDVMLYRVENSTLYFLKLRVPADPLWEGEPIEWHEEHLAPVPLDTGSADDIPEALPRLK